MIKTKKRRKVSRMHGRKMGTHGTGARKNKRDSGNRGGKGMAGSGKRADHKKTLITKKFGNKYFGKKGITSRGTRMDKVDRINLQQIESNLESLGKKVETSWEVELKKYKILGKGNVKNKLIIKAKEASKSAIEKVEKIGGRFVFPSEKKIKEKIEKKIVDKKENEKIENESD